MVFFFMCTKEQKLFGVSLEANDQTPVTLSFPPAA